MLQLQRAEKAHALKPTDQSIMCGLATCLMRLGRLDDAEEYYRKSLAISRDHLSTLVNYAVLLEDCRSKSIEACYLYRRALDIDSSHPVALGNYAHILCKLGEYARAEVLLKRSLKLFPSEVTVLHNYGCLLWEWRKDFKKAEEVLIQAIRINPGHQATVNALVELREERVRAEKQAAEHASALLAELELGDGTGQQARDKGCADTVAKFGAKKARRRKKKTVQSAALPDDGQPAVQDSAARLHEGKDGLPEQNGDGRASDSVHRVDFEPGAHAAPPRHLDLKENGNSAHGHASNLPPEAGKDDATEDLVHGARSAPQSIQAPELSKRQGDASDPSSPLLASLLASSPVSPLRAAADAPHAQTTPPKTPAAMRSWLLSSSNSFEEKVQDVAAEDEKDEVQHLIDDHGIMHVITRASPRGGAGGQKTDCDAPSFHHTYSSSSPSGILPFPSLTPAPQYRDHHLASFPVPPLALALLYPHAPCQTPCIPAVRHIHCKSALVRLQWSTPADTTGLSVARTSAGPPGKDSALASSPFGHTLIYSNWRDRRDGDSAPLMGGERGESIQSSVAEAAAAAREREAMEKDAKLQEEVPASFLSFSLLLRKQCAVLQVRVHLSARRCASVCKVRHRCVNAIRTRTL